MDNYDRSNPVSLPRISNIQPILDAAARLLHTDAALHFLTEALVAGHMSSTLEFASWDEDLLREMVRLCSHLMGREFQTESAHREFLNAFGTACKRQLEGRHSQSRSAAR